MKRRQLFLLSTNPLSPSSAPLLMRTRFPLCGRGVGKVYSGQAAATHPDPPR
jgi:hypothetical protein